jgi:predicted ATPase/class 3 adenylate cyclase
MSVPSTATFQIGSSRVEPATLRVVTDDHETRTEARVMQVLLYLVQHAGDVVSRAELEEELWPGRVVTRDSVTKAVTKLRRVLGDDARRPRVIETIPKRGYRLIADVKWAGRTEEDMVPISTPSASDLHAGTCGISGERRHLVLIFCSLADAPMLSSRCDPEEMQQKISSFRACCKHAIGQFGGRVARQMADGVLAYFGYPAFEFSAERATRSGLKILALLGETPIYPGPRLRARIAIASGEVVVGNSRDEHTPGTEEITGEVVHLVAELQRGVEPEQIVAADNVKQKLGGLFEYRDLGRRKLAGFERPVHIWRLLGESRQPRRFETMHEAIQLTPLVGRQEEGDSLLRRWKQARTGGGQVVVLTGEPGIGKSRLVTEFREALVGEAHVTLSYYGSPYHCESALFPIIKQIEHAAGFRPDDTPEAKRNRLKNLLAQSGRGGGKALALLADLLSIAPQEVDPLTATMPERRRELTLQALEELLASLASRQPVLVVFEDLHYVDPTTRDLLDRMVERVQSLPAMIIVTHRATLWFPWSFESHVTNLVLRKLDGGSSETLVRTIAGRKTLPARVVTQIVSSADGNPLFIEELTRTVLGGTDDGNEPNAQSTAVLLPSSLRDPLLARIDHLGTAKAVAQTAAVIGRRFSFELLALISQFDEKTLSNALLQLTEAAVIYPRGAGSSTKYRFKHALVQEAIYSTLLRPAREDVHSRVVRALEERFAETAEKEPELVAHHCVRAGLVEKAVSYWQKAAEQAIGRSAVAEATSHLTNALDILATFKATASRATQELALRIQLGRVQILNKGYAAPEVEAAYKRARELCEETGDRHQLFLVLLGSWQLYISRQDLEAARRLDQQLLALAQSQQDVHFLLEANVAESITSHAKGAFVDALTRANRAIALYDPAQHHGHGARFGQDAGVMAGIMAAWALWCLGYPDQSLTRMREAQTVALDLDQPYTLAMADYCSAWLHQYRAEPDTACKEAERAIDLSSGQGYGWPLAFARILHGWALAEQRLHEESIAEMSNGLMTLRTMGAELWQPHLLALFGTAHAAADQTEEALSLLDKALNIVATTGEREYASELYRLKGELLAQVKGQAWAERAEACFRQAIEIAVEQRAKSWELRAAMSLATLLRDQKKKAQARALLAPVYDWFTEGYATPDLRAAEALLETLYPNTP